MRTVYSLALLLAIIVTGCTFSQIKPEIAGTPPSQPPKILVVGDVGVTDALWEPYRLHFRRGVSDWLQRNGGFETVLIERPSPPPPGSIVLVGRIIEVDKGSAVAMR